MCAFTISLMVKSQCTVTIVSSGWGGGLMTFTAIASPTNTGTYFWDFGNNTYTTNVNVMTASAVYTANNTYTATCTYINPALGCTVSSSMQFPIVTACSLSINYTPPNPLNACNGSATLTNQGACPNPTTSWSNGSQGSVVNGLCANTLYTVVTNGGFNCCPNLQGSLFISSCNLNASLSRTLGPNGLVNFASTSTGTTAATTYTLVYGDGASASSVTTLPSHTYSSNGTYTVELYASNNNTNNCVSDTAYILNIINIPPPCTLAASFTYAINNGTLQAASTSTGVTGNTIYNWNFGNGNTASGQSTNHVYTTSGTYTLSLIAINPPACVDTAKTAINVQIVSPCPPMTADFTHTVSNNGLVLFSNTSIGTNTNTIYFWNFGDGIYSNVNSPTHTYNSAGAYNVNLRILNSLNLNCADSTVYSVNVTGLPCLSNAGFNLSPGAQPQYWNAIPVYPWNVTNAVWYWGDGSSSNGLYSSHIYSMAGSYDICLTVTTSCGGNDSSCVTSSIFKTTDAANLMIYVNVTKPGLSTGITRVDKENLNIGLFPNPNSGEFTLRGAMAEVEDHISVTIVDLFGKTIYVDNIGHDEWNKDVLIKITDPVPGIYLVQVKSGNNHITKKMVISQQ